MREARTNKAKLMRDVQLATFRAVETNLYLDTHPYDNDALCALRKYEALRKEAIDRYETAVGPVLAYGAPKDDDNFYKWVTEPFPWEMED